MCNVIFNALYVNDNKGWMTMMIYGPNLHHFIASISMVIFQKGINLIYCFESWLSLWPSHWCILGVISIDIFSHQGTLELAPINVTSLTSKIIILWLSKFHIVYLSFFIVVVHRGWSRDARWALVTPLHARQDSREETRACQSIYIPLSQGMSL